MLSGTVMQLRSPLANSNCMSGLTRTATRTDSPVSSLEKMDWPVDIMRFCVGFVCGLMDCSKLVGCDMSLALLELEPFAMGLFGFMLFKFNMWI